jgi:hypothetical protein
LHYRETTLLFPIEQPNLPPQGRQPIKHWQKFNKTVYQLLAQGRWFSLGTPASSTTKTGRHDIAEILLKVALKHQKSNQSILLRYICFKIHA